MSTYLYCFIAGAYVSFTSEKEEIQNFRYPLSVLCRKSLGKFMKDQCEQWLHVTKCGIEFYEDLFSCPYPWGKMDAAFVPDYPMGAMENVGLVTYNDLYVQRDELFSEPKNNGIAVTFLHEIAHMWFGNLVTMKWWDDLWLNESFADFVCYINFDEAKGLEQYKNCWTQQMDSMYWGLGDDQAATTHPIACDVIHT